MKELNKSNVENLSDFIVQNSTTKSPIQEVIKYISREVKKHKLTYRQLKYIFKCAREKCNIEVPREQRKLPQLPTQEELDQFYSVIKDPIHKLIFEFLEGSGLRISEVVHLKVTNIDFELNVIYVKNGKGGKDRASIIGNKLKEKIKLYLNKKNNEYLFESCRHSKYSTRRIQQIFESYRIKAKIEKKFSIHTFRHLYLTHLAQNKISVEIRQLLAGHSNAKTQAIYTHLSIGGFAKEISAILDNKK